MWHFGLHTLVSNHFDEFVNKIVSRLEVDFAIARQTRKRLEYLEDLHDFGLFVDEDQNVTIVVVRFDQIEIDASTRELLDREASFQNRFGDLSIRTEGTYQVGLGLDDAKS